MKLSTKTILPIILISAMLILLTGCIVTPSDEQPGYTPGTITGIIAAPCCSTSAEDVSEPCCVSPEYWCYYCQQTWKLQNEVEVILTYGEDEVATTNTNQYGEYTFTNVSPGKNYVVTAYCPDFEDNRPLVKDVALELVEGGAFDTKITDLVSTSLGLVVDFLVVYTEWGPEDIVLDDVIADKPNFPNFPKFKKLVLEVRRVLENCGNVNTDEDVQDALCLAAEEISKLDIGCAPGYTPSPPGPGPTPTPGECDNNTAPILTVPGSITIDAGTTYTGTASATDDGIRFGPDLIFSASVAPTPTNGLSIDPDTGEITWVTDCLDIVDDARTDYVVTVTVDDGCEPVEDSFTITLDPNICLVCAENKAPEITEITLNEVPVPSPPSTVHLVVGTLYEVCVYANDDDILSQELTYSLTIDDGINTPFDIGMGTSDSGGICYQETPLFEHVGTYKVYVNVDDGCDTTTWGPFTVVFLESITVIPGTMNLCKAGTGTTETETGTIETIAHYSDGTSAPVTPDSYDIGNNSIVASVSVGGLVTSGSTTGSTAITVHYKGETATVTVNVTDCALPCESAALVDFILKTNKSDKDDPSYYSIDLYKADKEGDPGYDTIYVSKGTNHLFIKVSAECSISTIEYNYYDGSTCGAYWISQSPNNKVYPSPTDDPPDWLSGVIESGADWWPNNGKNPGLTICKNGGNILKIKVTNPVSEEFKIYTVVINRL